jgi:prepilin-type N-terminal cleavage/methylation domain-containing protein
MESIKNRAFTLVELIIVITILAVLATIAFTSYTWYSIQARDSVRVADIKTAYFWLNYYQTKNSKVPQANNFASIQISWNTISKQSDLWIEILSLIGMWWNILDPKTFEQYTYVTDVNNINFQVAGFLEQEEILYSPHNFSYANDENLFYSKWEYLWVIKDNSWDLVHKVVTIFNINDALWDVTAYFSQGNMFQWTWPELVAELQK